MNAKAKMTEAQKVIKAKTVFTFDFEIPKTVGGYKDIAKNTISDCTKLAIGKSDKNIAGKALIALVVNSIYNGGRRVDTLKGKSWKINLFNYLTARVETMKLEKDSEGKFIKLSKADVIWHIKQLEKLQYDYVVMDMAITAAIASEAGSEAGSDSDSEAGSEAGSEADITSLANLLFFKTEDELQQAAIALLQNAGYVVTREEKPAKKSKGKTA